MNTVTAEYSSKRVQKKWSEDHLPIRISAAQEAIKRARFAFFLCLLAATASFACLWNTHVSWYRDFGFSHMPAVKDSPEEKDGRQVTRAKLVEDELKSWVDSQSISINLLGIKIAVSDFAVLNSLALYAVVYYYLLASRRENREIGQILRDVSEHIDTMGYTVYASIASYMVFNLNRTDDNPISSLNPKSDEERTKINFIRPVLRIMALMPFLVVIFTIVCDLCSLFVTSHLFFSSPFRDGRIWDGLSISERSYALAMEAFAALIAYGTLKLISNASKYESATRSVLEEFQVRLSEANVVSPLVSES